MKNILKYGIILLLLLPKNSSVKAQEFNNIYKASDVVLTQTDGNQKLQQVLNNATILFPDNSNKLNVLINIPYSFLDSNLVSNSELTDNVSFAADSGITNTILFNLSIEINRDDIQQNLTSSKSYYSHGLLLLNGISKWVTVIYMPIASGSEEDGNFHISMIIQFNATDFNIGLPGNSSHFEFRISNARINRV